MGEILDAAEAIIVKDGWGEASMHAIARQAGVSPSSMYFYFPDLFMIFDEIIQRHDVQINKIVPKKLAKADIETWEDLITITFDSIAEYCRENKVARILTFGHDGPYMTRWTTSLFSNALANFIRGVCPHYFTLPDVKLIEIKFNFAADLIMAGFNRAVSDDGSIDSEILDEAQFATVEYMKSWMGSPTPLHPASHYQFIR